MTLGFLDYQRATLPLKCSGLDAAGLRATTAASTMTLGGILKHTGPSRERLVLPLTARPRVRAAVGRSGQGTLCHMIDKYARHNGHADLLRESVDGATGE
jgi:hypothetical protein